MQRFFREFASNLRKHRLLTLVLFLGVSALCGVYALQSRVDNSLAVWQSSDDPHWLQYQQFVAHYHIIDPLIVYLPGLDLLSLEDLTDAMQGETGAESIHSLSVRSLDGQEAGLFFIGSFSKRVGNGLR
ncbi:MAG: hypothetical protein AB7U29_12575 [Desulfobulbus sp.]